MYWRQVVALTTGTPRNDLPGTDPVDPIELEGSISGWEPKRLFHQLPKGTFEEAAFAEGFESRADGRSVVAADLDGDGDQDVLLLNRGGHLQLFRNDGPTGAALELRLEATHGNRDAAGALVRAGRRAFPVLLGHGYQSSVEPRVHVGLGTEKSVEVTVEWRAGAVERFGALAAGASYRLVEGTGHPSVTTPFKEHSRAEATPFPARVEQVGGKPGAHPTIVPLFAKWCEPCFKEVPALNALQKSGKYSVRGLGAHEGSELAEVVKAMKIQYPILPLSHPLEVAVAPAGVLSLPVVLVYTAGGDLFRVVRDPAALDAVLREL